uniref:Uncharacterized protein n=1 Tax=Anguilla anguilla TaxID=7936 RepID=A0A0E9UX90_ANGAN
MHFHFCLLGACRVALASSLLAVAHNSIKLHLHQPNILFIIILADKQWL